VRSRAGVAAALRELTDPIDARVHAESLRARLAKATGDDAVSAGVGGPMRGATGAHLALLQAEQAVVVGRGLRGDGRVTLFDDLGPYCFVLGRPESDIREFADRILGPLAEDGRHADLLRTLDAYLRLHGSLNAVARDLFLHRNTVRQRLRRIAKLTGADLNDAEARLALQLALLAAASVLATELIYAHAVLDSPVRLEASIVGLYAAVFAVTPERNHSGSKRMT